MSPDEITAKIEIAAKVAFALLAVQVVVWLSARAYEAVRREYHMRLIGRPGRYGSHR